MILNLNWLYEWEARRDRRYYYAVNTWHPAFTFFPLRIGCRLYWLTWVEHRHDVTGYECRAPDEDIPSVRKGPHVFW